MDAAVGLMVSLALLLACALGLITLFALTAPGRAVGRWSVEPPPAGGRDGLSAARTPTAHRRWRHVRHRPAGRETRGRSRIAE